MDEKKWIIPSPVIDQKEESSLVALTERYNKLIEPGVVVVKHFCNTTT